MLNFMSSLTAPKISVIALLLFIVIYYIRRGRPYLVRGTALLCALAYFTHWGFFHVANSKKCNVNQFSISELCFGWSPAFETENLLVWSKVLFLTSLFIKGWWNVKPNNFMYSTITDEASTKKKKTFGKPPPFYPNGWIPVLESRDLLHEKAKSVTVMGKQLAVFRGEDGKAHVLDAYCPHLGANLAIGGRVIGNCLECPFHGWQFTGEDGRCVRIPYAKCIPDAAKTRRWTSCEINGFIYIWHHAEGNEPTWELPDIHEFREGTWIYRGRLETIISCHIQDIAENGADFFHFPYVHYVPLIEGKWLSNLLGIPSVAHRPFEATWKESEVSPHIAELNIKHHIKFLNIQIPYSESVLKLFQIGPAYICSVTEFALGPILITMNITPEGPFRQRFISHVYTRFYTGQWLSSLIMLWTNENVIKDAIIWSNKVFLKKPILVGEDKTILRFRRWYSQFYSNKYSEEEFFEHCG